MSKKTPLYHEHGISNHEYTGTIKKMIINERGSHTLMVIELHNHKALVLIASKVDILTAMPSADDLSDIAETEFGTGLILELTDKLVTIIIEHFPYPLTNGNEPIILGEYHAHAHPVQILLANSNDTHFDMF